MSVGKTLTLPQTEAVNRHKGVFAPEAAWVRYGLWVAVAVAIVLRLGAALYLGDTVWPQPGIYDQVSYHTLALRVLDGHGFTVPMEWWPATRAGEPTAHWSYLYTLYLAGVYALFGPHPLAARLIQALVVGALGPYLAYRLGRRAFGPTAGLAAAGITALYIYFVYYGAALVTESLYILAVLWALDAALGLAEAPSWRRLVWLGLALGLAALLRQVILLFVPFLLLWLLWVGRGRLPIWRLVVPLAIIGVLILPWTVRNYLAFGRFVLLNTNAGFAFFWANHPVYGGDFVGVLPQDGPSYQELIPAELRELDEAALDQALLRRGLDFVFDDPVRYVRLSLSRTAEYFKFWPAPESGLVSNVARVASFGLCLPLMLAGLILSWRQRGRCWLFYLFIGVYTLIHLLSWALIRYRLPVDALLILFAGLAAAEMKGAAVNRALSKR